MKIDKNAIKSPKITENSSSIFRTSSDFPKFFKDFFLIFKN